MIYNYPLDIDFTLYSQAAAIAKITRPPRGETINCPRDVNAPPIRADICSTKFSVTVQDIFLL
jgi:hypothetical protein